MNDTLEKVSGFSFSRGIKEMFNDGAGKTVNEAPRMSDGDLLAHAKKMRENIDEIRSRYKIPKVEGGQLGSLDEEINHTNLHRKMNDMREEVKKLQTVVRRSGERSRLGLQAGTAGALATGVIGYNMGGASANNNSKYSYAQESEAIADIEVLAEEIVDDLIKEAMTSGERETAFTSEMFNGLEQKTAEGLTEYDLEVLASEITDEIIKEAGVGPETLAEGIHSGVKDFGVIAAADLASIAAARSIWGNKGGEPSEADPAGITVSAQPKIPKPPASVMPALPKIMTPPSVPEARTFIKEEKQL